MLSVLAAHVPANGEARFAGGVLAMDEHAGEMPRADARLTLRLEPVGALGRSRVHVTLQAPHIGFDQRELRIHGSGPQRLRRAAFAALDQVRRAR